MKRLTWYFLFLAIAVGCNKAPSLILTQEEQLVYDVQLIDEYLAQHHLDAIKLENGIRYNITETGTGPTPTKDNCFRMRYAGFLLNETVPFGADSTDGYKAPLKSQIIGVQILLKLMSAGSKGTVYIPSDFGYGPGGSPPTIPQNAVLRFDVELMNIYSYNALGNYCNE